MLLSQVSIKFVSLMMQVFFVYFAMSFMKLTLVPACFESNLNMVNTLEQLSNPSYQKWKQDQLPL